MIREELVTQMTLAGVEDIKGISPQHLATKTPRTPVASMSAFRNG